MTDAPKQLQAVEAELLGQVYDGSSETTAADLYFSLVPFDSVTTSHLSGTSFTQSVWIDTALAFPISYFNPEGDGPVCGGSYENFLSDDLTGSAQEIHNTGPGSGPPSGFETHCIIPGHYEVRLTEGSPVGTVLKSFRVDYLAGELGKLASAGSVDLWIEAPEFDPTGTRAWGDLVVNFHLNPSGSFSDNSVLGIENAGSNPYKSTFSNQSTLSGTPTDWFRYRTDESTSTWNLGSRGTKLMGLWLDDDDAFDRSGFFDHAERGVLRIHQYADETPPTTVTAGLEVKRPDEDPQSSPTVTRNISIVADPTPTACFQMESNSTWRYTDQFFNANCSSGANLQYRWDTGSGYGSYTSNPKLEFFGHSSTGSKPIKLQVRDLGQSPVTTDTEQKSIGVSGSVLSMSGPTQVSNKQLKTYTASINSDWYERYLSAGSTTWHFTLDDTTVYNRIWPAGIYTRRLRAEKVSSSPLGRRFLDVEVCHESFPECDEPMEFFTAASTGGPAAFGTDESGIFGMGPWIHSGQGVTRFYDLTGLHDPGSPFADTGWLGEPTGTAEASNGPFAVDWVWLEARDPDIRSVEFTVTAATGGAYRFGMAIDPDLGSSPADDRSGFDRTRNLVYVRDASGAVGFMLESASGRKVTGIEQYGARRAAPRAAGDAAEAGSADRVELIDGEDDVQFILSAAATSGSSSWRLTILRASSLSQLQAKADAYLDR